MAANVPTCLGRPGGFARYRDAMRPEFEARTPVLPS
jgi:hypothetical protein